MDELGFTIGRAVQHRSLREEVKRLRKAQAASSQFGEMVGGSPAMRKVYELLERVADTDATVLITGESGTGKELVAKALHRRGRRGNGPFVAVNCAAVPEPILESELFGHTKGAFTDAKTGRTGLFLQASTGTLFLDEIGEMPLGMQVKLLRALQERKVRPVGGEQEVPFDSRIVAATNRDLESEVAEHKFREDLYYRINVVRVQVPPLRARGNDVLLLAQNFVERFAAQNNKKVVGLSSPAAEKLLAYEWPGNVRELQNCVERAVEDPSELLTMEEVERRYILKVLQTVGGNKTLAAQVLGFDRRTLYRKLERYGAAEANAEES
jgi:two-component system response regulator HydG